jgi:hypothetical protein
MLLSNIYLQIVINVILIILTIATGMMLHKKGKPYNKVLISIHKIATMGFLIYLTFILVNCAKSNGFDAFLIGSVIVALIATGGLLFSGGMLSLDKAFTVNLWIHRITMFLFITAAIGILYKLSSF